MPFMIATKSLVCGIILFCHLKGVLFSNQLQEWIKGNLGDQNGLTIKFEWNCIWATNIWKIQAKRNKGTHNGSIIPLSVLSNNIVSFSKSTSWLGFGYKGIIRDVLLGKHPLVNRNLKLVRLKINIDETTNWSKGKAACGHLIKDEDEEWIVGFFKSY